MTLTVEALRADPAGNVTILVLSPVEPRLRAAAAVALLNEYGGEQAGFIVPPVSGGAARLEMMGGEFCGNALRCLGLWYAATRPGAAGRPVPMEISGVDGTLSVIADPADGRVSARMPLPAALGERLGMPTAEFPGIVHALCPAAHRRPGSGMRRPRGGDHVPGRGRTRHAPRRVCGGDGHAVF